MICAHFGSCGGCDLQHLSYPEQLAGKRERLDSLLRASLGDAAPEVRPLVGMPGSDPQGMPWHFRRKASFVFAPAAGRHPLVMGHYARGSKTVIPIEQCPVHSARANRLAFALRDHLARAGLSAHGGRGDRGILRHVVIRTTHDDREAIVVLVVTRNDGSLRAPLRAFLASPDRPDGLFVNVHDRPGPYLWGDQTIRIDGRARVRETRLGTSFLVSPTAFFQTNPDAAAVLVDEVLSALPPVTEAGRVLDLYAGAGLFAIPIAARGHVVTAVEENPDAVRDGEVNARLNRIPSARLRFVRARVEAAIGRSGRARPAVVILDPPRPGCPTAVLAGVFGELAPPRAIYVSCNPGALAADLPSIVGHGYRPARVQPVDMFPHTEHIEAVVVLDREAATIRRAGTRRRRLATHSSARVP
jgi:23S rRNA (uracil1939-C5)-methyltransferase